MQNGSNSSPHGISILVGEADNEQSHSMTYNEVKHCAMTEGEVIILNRNIRESLYKNRF